MDDMRYDRLVGDLVVDDARRALERERHPAAGRRYLVFFTARSGSSWLTALLSGTGRLGFPEEYINPAFVREVSGAMHARTQADLLDMLARIRRTPNGVFGMEMRAVDVTLFGEAAFFAAFGPQTVVFNLWRDNILAQGISLYRAVATGRYHSTDPAAAAPPAYDAAAIREWTRHLLDGENKNLEMLARQRRPARFLRYEDIMRDPATTVAQFCEALGVEAAPAAEANLAKIGDAWNREVEARFRREEPGFLVEMEAARLIRRQPGEPGWVGFSGR